MVMQSPTFFKQKKLKLPISQQTLLLEKIAQLLEQDYSIIDALQALQCHHHWHQILDYLSEQLEAGRKFDQILADLHFDDKIVSFIYFALQHGNLVQAINHSVSFVNQHIQLFNKFKQAIRYPIILLSVFFIVLFFIDLYIYPAFSQLYTHHSQPSSFLLLSINTVDFIFKALYVLIILLICLTLIWFIAKDKLTIKSKAKLLNLFSITSFSAKKYYSLMFASHLSALLETDLSFKDCLTLIIEHNEKALLSYYSRSLLNDLEQGVNLEHTLNKHGFFDKNLIIIFEKKVNRTITKRDLLTYSTLSLEQLHSFVFKVIQYIQPIVFIVIALSVVFIYLSILLPMFQLIQTI